MTNRLLPNSIEAANRAEATALLIRLGYRVYRPEADVEGEDLIIRNPSGRLVAVQIKSRLTVNWHKYGGQELSMLFPSAPWTQDAPRDWFLVPHDDLYEELRTYHGQTKSFAEKSWSSAKPSPAMGKWLEAYRLDR